MSLQRLKVSANGHFLVKEDGSPFFYLGDTAWQLFERLNREEVERYLQDRAARQFNVIQAVVLAEFGGVAGGNAYGDRPFVDSDTARPNPAYFRHVDFVVDRAETLGMYVGLLPCWGKYVNNAPNKPPTRIFTEHSAEAYGAFLGRRYGERKNLLWVLGGDSRPDGDTARSLWRALARGIVVGAGGREEYGTTLMTYHPPGGTWRPPATSSGEFFHEERWLDFNMIQSGHRPGNRNYERISEDYARRPAKPTLDAEPCYEEHPELQDPTRPRFHDGDVRQRAYWSVFAGACGHTYGHNSIWRFHAPGGPGAPHAKSPWREALGHPGADQMRHLRALVESRPFLTRIPDQSLIVSSPEGGMDHVRATRDADGRYAFVYLPTGNPVTIRRNALSGDTLTVSWFDPRTGESHPAGAFPRAAEGIFRPPSSGEGKDWVLVLDDAAERFPVPGRGTR